MVTQIPSTHIIHHQIEVFFVLEGACDVDNEWVVDASEYASLVHDGECGVFEDDFGFRHFLHSIEYAVLFFLDLPYFAEASPSYNVHKIEHMLFDFW